MSHDESSSDEEIEEIMPPGQMSHIPDDFCEVDPDELIKPEVRESDNCSETGSDALGVSQVQWRITHHSLPKKHRPSIDYDPVLYHCENFEIDSIIGDLSFDDGIREIRESHDESSMSHLSDSDRTDNYIDIDQSIIEESHSTQYTKPYIKLRVDWM